MRFVPTPLAGAVVIEQDKREDERGFFARVFCEREFAKADLDTRYVQINNSLSKDKGTLRGMHYQLGEAAEVKIVRCGGQHWLALRPGSEAHLDGRKIQIAPEQSAQQPASDDELLPGRKMAVASGALLLFVVEQR